MTRVSSSDAQSGQLMDPYPLCSAAALAVSIMGNRTAGRVHRRFWGPSGKQYIRVMARALEPATAPQAFKPRLRTPPHATTRYRHPQPSSVAEQLEASISPAWPNSLCDNLAVMRRAHIRRPHRSPRGSRAWSPSSAPFSSHFSLSLSMPTLERGKLPTFLSLSLSLSLCRTVCSSLCARTYLRWPCLHSITGGGGGGGGVSDIAPYLYASLGTPRSILHFRSPP